MRELIPAISIAGFAATAASAGITLDEGTFGDFSDDRFNPTRAVLASGTNRISGRFGISPTPDVHDLDYVTFRVEAGWELTSFRVASASVGGAFAFVAIQSGPIVTIPADWTSINSPLLGWAHCAVCCAGTRWSSRARWPRSPRSISARASKSPCRESCSKISGPAKLERTTRMFS